MDKDTVLAIQIKFLASLNDDKMRKDFIALQPEPSSSKGSMYNQPAQDSWKMKTRCHTHRSHHFDHILETNHQKRFQMAVMTNNIDSVIDFLKVRRLDPNIADQLKRTPLHLATTRGYVEIIKLLIYYGANPNRKDSLGNTPLHLAACVCNGPVIRTLVSGGAEISIMDNNNRLPCELLLGRHRLNDTGLLGSSSAKHKEIAELYSLLNPNLRNEDLNDAFGNLELK